MHVPPSNIWPPNSPDLNPVAYKIRRHWFETASGWDVPEVWPYLNETLFQIIDVEYAPLILSLGRAC